MTQRLFFGAALGALLILCACASTSLKQTWKSPELREPVGKIAVIAIEERGLLRQGFENRLARELNNVGAPAVITYDQMSLGEMKQDKRAAAEALKKAGAEAVFLLRIGTVQSSFRELQPGGERYAGTVIGFETTGWYDYFSMGFMSMSPTYGSSKANAYVEAVLYDLKNEKRVWCGLSKTVIKESTDRIAELDPLAQKFVEAMRRDGAIR